MATKRPADEVEERVVVNAPKQQKADPPTSVCTIDTIVRDLAGDHVLSNVLMWDYVHRGEMKADTLTEALHELVVNGNPRKDTMRNLVNRFWELHSKYIAPTCSDIRHMYADILGHVVSLAEKYGEVFLKNNGPAEQHLVELLAEECGEPDEAENSASENYQFLQGNLDDVGLRGLIDKWLAEYGSLPDSEGAIKDRVNPQKINGWWFRKEGLLDFCINLISQLCLTIPAKSKDDFIAYDLKNIAGGTYKLLPSCILLAKRCKLRKQTVTKLHNDWWGDSRAQALIDSPEVNAQTRNDISTLFVYSGVDPPAGILKLLREQADSWQMKDKSDSSYDDVKVAHLTGKFTPWRTQGGEWSEDSSVEDLNYKAIESRLNYAVGFEEYRKKAKRAREESEPVITLATPAPKKVKTKEVAPPEEETNYALIGGLLAVTAGVAAIALSRS